VSWLTRSEATDSLATPAPLVAVWLSGQVVHSHSHLSASQTRLLAQVASAGWAVVPGGLPYDAAGPCPTADGTGTCAEATLPVASARSLAQYLTAPYGFGTQVARFLRPVVDATGERLLVVVGSAGAQMLTAACERLAWPERLGLDVVALGPVGRLPSRARTFVVQARRDRISRLGYRGTVDVVVPGAHMGYPDRPEVRRVVSEVAARWAADARVRP